MLCQNCERSIEPGDEQCPHCGARPLHRRTDLANRREEFELTPEEDTFEIGESTEGKVWSMFPEPDPAPAAPTEETRRVEEPVVQWGGFVRRAGAFLLDLIIVAALTFLMLLLAYIGYKVGLSAHGRAVSWANVTPLLVSVTWGGIGLITLYFVVFHGMEGKTVGKWLLGLKVVGAERETISYSRAFLRWLGTVGLCFGFLWVLWSREKRAWHDYLARTWVIRA